MQTVVETPVFRRRAEKLLSEHELAGLISYLASDPKAGDALLVYGKNERADLTANQRKAVADFAAAIKATRKQR